MAKRFGLIESCERNILCRAALFYCLSILNNTLLIRCPKLDWVSQIGY